MHRRERRVVGQQRTSGSDWPALIHHGARVLTASSILLIIVVLYRARTADAGAIEAVVNQQPVLLVLGLVTLARSGSVAVFRPERGQVPALVKTMTAWSFALAGAVILVWFIASSSVRTDHWAGTPVLNETEVAQVLGEQRSSAAGNAPSFDVPTGVLIQSLEFLNTNNVQVTGYVWQKYGPSIPADITRGVVFPEAIEEAYTAEEVYRVTQQDTELVGWYFHAIFRQPFDYGLYPFDRQDVWVRLWHPNSERGVMLVPDFDSYHSMEPRSLPGTEEQFVYSGWEPEDSGFSYVAHRYNTTFGFETGFDTGSVPELYFNLALKRDFLGTFISQILLVSTTALLLFLVLALTTNDEVLHGRFEMSTSGVLATLSGLLFVVVYQHNQLRSVVGQDEVAYIEVMPFLLYLLIPLVALNAIAVASSWNLRFVCYRHNLIPKLLYWPLLLGLLLAFTMVIFLR